MKRLYIFLLITSFCYHSHCQDVEYYRVKDNLKEFTLTPYHNNDMVMWKLQIIMGDPKRVIYLDTINGFKVKVPDWLDLRETRSLYFFGGTLPPIGEVENAITITSQEHFQHENFAEFKKYIVENSDYLQGTSPSWSDGSHYIKSVEKSKLLKYDSYKVELQFNGNPFLVNYVLLKTNKSYVWINFAATKETYDKNFKRFKKFLKSFEVLE